MPGRVFGRKLMPPFWTSDMSTLGFTKLALIVKHSVMEKDSCSAGGVSISC